MGLGVWGLRFREGVMKTVISINAGTATSYARPYDVLLGEKGRSPESQLVAESQNLPTKVKHLNPKP